MKHKIYCSQSKKLQNGDLSSLFVIEPLNVGQAVTLGNSLRRTLLSEVSSYAISSIRINNVPHEFAILPFLREDIMDVILNLRSIVFQPSLGLLKDNSQPIKAVLSVKGPIVVTAGMFLLPFNILRILNPNQYICTITASSALRIELELQKGKGYISRECEENHDLLDEGKVGKLSIDSSFSPIKKVTYKVKLINDSAGNVKESLGLEITTNGSVTPKRALMESLKSLLELLGPLLVTDAFLNLHKN